MSDSPPVPIAGHCDPRFASVREVFEKKVAESEVGASIAFMLDGELVVDLWGGYTSRDQDEPWGPDTIANTYSTTKGMTALIAHRLVEQGKLDLDAPVAEYWPEFAAQGKDAVTVAHVMSHSAGLSGFDPPLETVETLYDWDACVDRLAAQAPWWEPGTRPGYHAITQGYLQGEIVRRVTGRSLGTFFREEVAEPLGADFHIGLDARHDGRVADLDPPRQAIAAEALGKPDSIAARTLTSVPITALEPRTRAWRAAEIPAAGGIGHARSVARIHSALACGGRVDGVTLLSEAGVARALEPQVSGRDQVLGLPVVFGQGFGLNQEQWPISPNPRAMFWGGWGGSLAIVDLDARVTVSYVMNRMEADLMGDPRGARIAAATFEALSA